LSFGLFFWTLGPDQLQSKVDNQSCGEHREERWQCLWWKNAENW